MRAQEILRMFVCLSTWARASFRDFIIFCVVQEKEQQKVKAFQSFFITERPSVPKSMFRLDSCVFTWPTSTLFKPIFKLLADLEQVDIHVLGSDGCVDGLEYLQSRPDQCKVIIQHT